jgi:hypothetical protein
MTIQGGINHSLALLNDGTVRAWGSNDSGQLGDGTTTNRSAPVLVSGLSGVIAIGAGEGHSLALGTDEVQLSLGVNQSALHSGGAHTVRASLLPGSAPVPANVYVALQLPDASLLYLRGDRNLTLTAEPIASVNAVPTYTGQIFQQPFTGTESRREPTAGCGH